MMRRSVIQSGLAVVASTSPAGIVTAAERNCQGACNAHPRHAKLLWLGSGACERV